MEVILIDIVYRYMILMYRFCLTLLSLLSTLAALQFPSLPPDHMISLRLLSEHQAMALKATTELQQQTKSVLSPEIIFEPSHSHTVKVLTICPLPVSSVVLWVLWWLSVLHLLSWAGGGSHSVPVLTAASTTSTTNTDKHTGHCQYFKTTIPQFQIRNYS